MNTTTTFEWVPEIDRLLAQGGRYRFAVLAPGAWTSDQTQTYLEGKGWNVVSTGKPPADVAQSVANVQASGVTAPTAWWVIATWTGATGTKLPLNDGSVVYATLDYYSSVPAGEGAIGQQPASAPPLSSGVAPILAFAAGVAVVSGMIWLVKAGARGGMTLRHNPVSEDVDQDLFVWHVKRLAKTIHGKGRFGRDKVFISAIIDAARERDLAIGDLTDAQFKHELLAAHRAGKLELSRADLTSAMDSNIVRRSEIHYLNATFHFVND